MYKSAENNYFTGKENGKHDLENKMQNCKFNASVHSALLGKISEIPPNLASTLQNVPGYKQKAV